MFQHLTYLFSDSKIARELGPDMVPNSGDPDYEENRSICTEIILELRENEELDKASPGISILLLFDKQIFIYLSIYISKCNI